MPSYKRWSENQTVASRLETGERSVWCEGYRLFGKRNGVRR